MSTSHTDTILEAVHLTLVLDKIASGYSRSAFRSTIAGYYTANDRKYKRLIQLIGDRADLKPSLTSFRQQKWSSLGRVELEELLIAIRGGDVRSIKSIAWQLTINIMEATNYDREEGTKANVPMGLALAASTSMATPDVPVEGELRLRYSLGKPWFDAYTAWNLL
jgi:hypothetical protein